MLEQQLKVEAQLGVAEVVPADGVAVDPRAEGEAVGLPRRQQVHLPHRHSRQPYQHAQVRRIQVPQVTILPPPLAQQVREGLQAATLGKRAHYSRQKLQIREFPHGQSYLRVLAMKERAQGRQLGLGRVCNIKMKKQESRMLESIIVLQRKNYGCLAKIFCCKCIHCCQDFDFSLLTSENRKSAFQRMITRYIKGLHANKRLSIIMDPFFILVALLLGEDSGIYGELMAIVNSQSEPAVFSKEDLEFYIPELCTYLVFHEELKNIELEKLLVRACKVDIHFSLKYYFYMKSLEIMQVGDTEIRKFERVSQYNAQFRTMISNYYQPQRFRDLQDSFLHEQHSAADVEDRDQLRSTTPPLTHSDITLSKKSRSELCESSIGEGREREREGQDVEERSIKEKFKVNKLRYLQQSNVYEPVMECEGTLPRGLFESTINFFSDLVELSKRLVQSSNRKQELVRSLQEVNRRLPATIYIPFTKSSYQDLNIINIVASEARVFNTKERAPYYICLESFYNPTYNQGISKDKKIRSFTHLKMKHIRKTDLFEEDCVSDVEDLRESQISINLEGEKGREKKEKQKEKEKEKTEGEDMRSSNHSSEKEEKRGKKRSWSSLFKLTKQIKKKILNEKTENEESSSEEDESQVKSEQQSKNLVGEQNQDGSVDETFGVSEVQQYQAVSQISPYSNLPGYKLIHVIIKSYDDLRQESFAMQLLQEFDKIFKIERLQVRLLPYEVLPLSHEAGIMECVRDAITIDELKRKGKTLLGVLDSRTKRKNFIHTLTAYSLVTYFLQVKDRHNGNIMIRKDGCIFHIDYGFFMSNLPGKGVQIEKNLPFKLTNEYVQALGGLKSNIFQDFRKLFYQAFNACRKHQHRILILTKLMYSSYGKTMPCFNKGDEAIDELEKRFNPPGVSNDAEISVYCQNLINSSIDNWRSRWYDKWQYYVQGIFY